MHFVCCIKQVPDTTEVKIDPQTNTLVRAGVESISNPFDMVALEKAIQLREEYGGKVTAISMGPPQGQSSLREALAMGADEAILLSDRAFAGADTLATSYTLARAIEKIASVFPVDVVFCGKQAIDGDTAQTGPGIATRLGLTQFTYVTAIDSIDVAKKRMQVRRKLAGGIEIIEGPLPVLITCELELATPRRASLPFLIRSMTAPVNTYDAKAIGAAPEMVGLKGSPTWVKAIFSPAEREGGPVFDGRTEIGPAVSEALDTLLQEAEFASKFLKRWKS